jgi:transcriptional regulator with XRE-family HTH domain
MQEENEQNLTFIRRVDVLRFKRGWTLAEVCNELGISRTMLHFIKTAKNGVTAKLLYRLEQAEVSAGIKSPLPSVDEVRRRSEELDTAELEYRKGTTIALLLAELLRRIEAGSITRDSVKERLNLAIDQLNARAVSRSEQKRRARREKHSLSSAPAPSETVTEQPKA